MLAPVTAPQPFVSVPEVKRNLHVEHNDHDAMLKALIVVAIADLDGPTGRLGRALGVQTWDWWPPATMSDALLVPLPPLREVVSIADSAGTVLDPASYSVSGINTSWGGTITLANGGAWPPGSVIRFEAGYPSVPEPIRQAVMLMVGEYYSTGGEKVASGVVEEPAIARLLTRFWVPRIWSSTPASSPTA